MGSGIGQFLAFWDGLIVCRFAGTAEFAAISAAGAAVMPVMGLALGLSAGGAIPIALARGKRDFSLAARRTAGAILAALLGSAFVTVLAEALTRPLLSLSRAPEDILASALTYSRIALLSIPLAAFGSLMCALLRAAGNARAAVRYQVIGASLALPIDFILLGPMQMGAPGAAVSGLLTQALAAFLAYRAASLQGLLPSKGDFHRWYAVEAAKCAVPVSLQYAVGAAGGMAFQSMVNARGTLAVASVAASERAMGLIAMPARAAYGAVEVFCGHNAGAGYMDRVRQGVRGAIKLSVLYGAAAFCALALFGKSLTSVFVSAPAPFIGLYLLINGAFLPLEFANGVLRNALQGLGRPGLAAFSSALDAGVRIAAAIACLGSLPALLLIQPVGIVLSALTLSLFYLSAVSARKGGSAVDNRREPKYNGERTQYTRRTI